MASRKDLENPSIQKIIRIIGLSTVEVCPQANDSIFRKADDKAQGKETSAEFIQSIKDVTEEKRQAALRCIKEITDRISRADNERFVERCKETIVLLTKQIGVFDEILSKFSAKQSAAKNEPQQNHSSINVHSSKNTRRVLSSDNQFSWWHKDKLAGVIPTKGNEFNPPFPRM